MWFFKRKSSKLQKAPESYRYYEELLASSIKDNRRIAKEVANIPPFEQIQAEQKAHVIEEKKSTFFDKFKASRATRKQEPNSSATPAIKSLRGRKV